MRSRPQGRRRTDPPAPPAIGVADVDVRKAVTVEVLRRRKVAASDRSSTPQAVATVASRPPCRPNQSSLPRPSFLSFESHDLPSRRSRSSCRCYRSLPRHSRVDRERAQRPVVPRPFALDRGVGIGAVEEATFRRLDLGSSSHRDRRQPSCRLAVRTRPSSRRGVHPRARRTRHWCSGRVLPGQLVR